MKRLELKISLSQAWNTCDDSKPGQIRVIAQVLNSIGFDEPMEFFGHKCRKDGTCVFFLFDGWDSPIKQILEEVTRKYFLPKPAVGQVWGGVQRRAPLVLEKNIESNPASSWRGYFQGKPSLRYA